MGGIWTIGYGHTGPEVGEGFQITHDQAEEILLKDLNKFETGVSCQVSVPLTDNQFSALVSFTFNVGLGHFHDSTLLKRLNEGKYELASNWILPWCKVHGVEVEGLLQRRIAERNLFLKG